MRQAKRKRSVVALSKISVIFAVVIWWGAGALYMQYARTRPPRPDPATGRIFAYQQIYHVFYLNAHERLLWRSLISAALACLLLTGGLLLYARYLEARTPTESDPEATRR